MPIPGDYPGMTNSQLDSYISDFLAAIYGEEVRDKFARIAYLIGHQIPASVEPSVQAAAASAAEAAEEAENAASSANSAAGSANSAYGSMQNASQSATNAANSATAAKTAQTAAEAAQEAAENAAQNATDAAGGNFLPKSGGKMSGDIILGENDNGTDTVELRGPQSQNPARVYFSAKTATYPTVTVAGGGGGKITVGDGGGVSLEGASVSLQRKGGNLTANGNRIQSVATPIAETDAANKAFVEESIQNVVHYGTCSTAAATAVKVVQCDGFKLAIGARIAVKFTYKNTYAASPVQLNVNGTGAKYARMYDDQHSVIMWEAGAIVDFIYDGSQYLMNSASTAVTLVNTLPVSKGGTGATTAAQALANLGVFNADPVYSKRVTVFGQTSSDNYIDLRVYKIGFVCFVNVSSVMMTDGSNGVTFQEFALPETCKPLTSAMGVSAEVSGNKIGGMTRWEITGDLKLKFTASNPASWFERHCCFSYAADNSGW